MTKLKGIENLTRKDKVRVPGKRVMESRIDSFIGELTRNQKEMRSVKTDDDGLIKSVTC